MVVVVGVQEIMEMEELEELVALEAQEELQVSVVQMQEVLVVIGGGTGIIQGLLVLLPGVEVVVPKQSKRWQ